jgi:NAD(P)-dependent dehydrogenase (short-subunit alcohol dehydrogenase family)
LDTACEDLEQVLAVNVLGPFRLSKALAGGMALRGEGLIVHVTSDASVQAYPRWGAYSVSKAALDHLARLWAVELGELGVRVLSVDPGEMRTRMHADAMPEADPATLADPDDVARRIVELIRRSHELPNGARLEASP